MDPVNVHIEEIVTAHPAGQESLAADVSDAIGTLPGVPGVLGRQELAETVARSVLAALERPEYQ
jgi:hypothetical protein